MKYQAHPLAELFPEVTGERLRELAYSIEDAGLLDPITLLDGQILDGRCRYAACKVAGVEPRFVEFDGESPVAFVFAKNYSRRDLTPAQRALAAAKMVPALAAEAKARQRVGKRLAAAAAKVGKAADAAGKAAGVSGDSVERAAKVLRDGAPETVEAVRKGELSLSAGAKLSALPPDEQVKRIARDMGRAPKRDPRPALLVEARKLLTRVRAKFNQVGDEAAEWLPDLNRMIQGVDDLLKTEQLLKE